MNGNIGEFGLQEIRLTPNRLDAPGVTGVRE